MVNQFPNFRFQYVPMEPEIKTLSFGMNDQEDANRELNEDNLEQEEDQVSSDEEEESDSEADDSFSDLASSHDEEDDGGDADTVKKTKPLNKKGGEHSKGEKIMEIPFVFKG